METPITELEKLDPERLDAVPSAANGFPVLMMKSLDGADPQYRESVEMAGQDDYDDDDADDEMSKAYVCDDDAECEVCKARLAKAKLTSAQRKHLSGSQFVFPKKRKYPIYDKAHARNALSRVAQFGTPQEKKRVRNAVHAKYPAIGAKKASQVDYESDARDGSAAEARSQTVEVEGQHGAVHMDVKREGNDLNPESKNNLAGAMPQGGGDTAPDKSLPMDEACEQTHETMRKAKNLYPSSDDAGADARRTVDMGGAKAGDRDYAKSKRESSAQTKRRMRKTVAVKADGEYAESEAHDVALGEAAGKLLAHAQELVRELTQHEHAEEEAAKGFPFTPLQSEEALAQVRDLLGGLTQNMRRNTLAAKELDDMTVDELRGLLDERDAKIVKSLKRKLRKAKDDKKVKKGRKAKAAKAVVAEPLVDAAEIARRAAEAAGNAVKAAVEPLEDRVNRMAAEKASPRPRPALNERADPQAVLRDQAAKGDDSGDPASDGNAFKALEERFAKATDPHERERLGRELTTARFVSAERQRHGAA